MKNNNEAFEKIKTQSYSKKELCEMYKISLKTLKNWFIRAGMNWDNKIRIFNPKQVSEIFKNFGYPD